MTDVKLYVDGLIEKYVSMSAPEYVRLETIVKDIDGSHNVSQEDYNAIMDLVLGQALYGYANEIYEMKVLKEAIESNRELIEDAENDGLAPVVVGSYKQLEKALWLIEELEK